MRSWRVVLHMLEKNFLDISELAIGACSPGKVDIATADRARRKMWAKL